MSYFPLSFPNVAGIPDWLSLIAVSPLSETLALFLRDGAYVTDPVIADSLATYTPGVSERRGGTTRYTHSGLKNTGAQSTNAIVATRVYDAYGMVRSSTGTWPGSRWAWRADPKNGFELLRTENRGVTVTL